MLKVQLKSLIATAILLVSSLAYSLQVENKLWISTHIINPITADGKFRYFIRPELRFIDDHYKFSQALVWVGLGYHTDPTLSFYLGYAYDISLSRSGNYNHQHMLFQEVNKRLFKTSFYELENRIRLEEVRRIHESGWPIVLRERLQLSVPIERLPTYSIILSEEPYLNLRHTEWSNIRHFVVQNRLFAGLQKELTKKTSFQVGYMNQYVWDQPRESNNVFIVELIINNS